MASEPGTLNLDSIRLQRDYPIGEVQAHRVPDPVKHPEAAAIARARIAAIPDSRPIIDFDRIPATPTADLITDRNVLADEARKEPLTQRGKLPSVVKPMITAVGIFALVLLLFKSPILLSQIGYNLHAKPTPTPVTTTAPAAAVVPAANTLTIDKLNVHAPVIYEPSVAEANVQRALQDGVVHYGNTALPGQTGNVAIFGHSSNDWWEPGNYKFVFVLLDKLAVGDRLSLDYQSHRYTYEVTSSKVVEPTDVGVLSPTTTPTLTLITCTPPGTSLKRLVVSARQVDPNPSQAATPTSSPATGQQASTPGDKAPGLMNQITQAWNGLTRSVSSLFSGGNAATTQPTAQPSPSPDTLPIIK